MFADGPVNVICVPDKATAESARLLSVTNANATSSPAVPPVSTSGTVSVSPASSACDKAICSVAVLDVPSAAVVSEAVRVAVIRSLSVMCMVAVPVAVGA